MTNYSQNGLDFRDPHYVSNLLKIKQTADLYEEKLSSNKCVDIPDVLDTNKRDKYCGYSSSLTQIVKECGFNSRRNAATFLNRAMYKFAKEFYVQLTCQALEREGFPVSDDRKKRIRSHFNKKANWNQSYKITMGAIRLLRGAINAADL